MPAPWSQSDDMALVDGCISGDRDAWRMLFERHGRLVDAVAIRALDERRDGNIEDEATVRGAVADHLQRDQGARLRSWNAASQLRTWLAGVARRHTVAYTQDATPPATLIASLPSPAQIFLDEMLNAEPAKQIADMLERLAPNFVALVRLRLRGLDRAGIAATLGVTQQAVVANLEKTAQKLGEMNEGQPESSVAAWRMLLDAAPMAERVEIAVRTEEDGPFRQVRSQVEGAWRSVRNRALPLPHPRGPLCLDEVQVAGFVDGTLRGAARARVEGHVTTCARCIDDVAALHTDLRVLGPLRDASEQDRETAIAAACVATTRFSAGALLSERGTQAGNERARQILRLAQIGLHLVGGVDRRRDVEPSGVQMRMPSDEEAPIVAFEAIAQADTHVAARAIDDLAARQTLGARLRLLAAAAGDDPGAARSLAAEVLARYHPDPGLALDAEAVLALPDGRALPRETVVERLRDAIPEAVRFVLVQS